MKKKTLKGWNVSVDAKQKKKMVNEYNVLGRQSERRFICR